MGPRTQVTEKECVRRWKRWKVVGLQKARFDRGLTLTEAASQLEITPGYLNTLELGRSDPSLLIAIRISRFYNRLICDLWVEAARK